MRANQYVTSAEQNTATCPWRWRDYQPRNFRWQFTGMTTAAVVSGNTVIIKPANTAGVIALLMELAEGRLSSGVINYLPSSGRTIGDYLVQHPRTRFINSPALRA